MTVDRKQCIYLEKFESLIDYDDIERNVESGLETGGSRRLRFGESQGEI